MFKKFVAFVAAVVLIALVCVPVSAGVINVYQQTDMLLWLGSTQNQGATGLSQSAFAGGLAVGTGAQGNTLGFTMQGVRQITQAGTGQTYTIVAGENGTHYDNNGATGAATFVLPASSPGMTFSFFVVTAQNIKIMGNGAEVIQNAASVSTATTGHIDCATSGGAITLVCHVAGKWVAIAANGTAFTVT